MRTNVTLLVATSFPYFSLLLCLICRLVLQTTLNILDSFTMKNTSITQPHYTRTSFVAWHKTQSYCVSQFSNKVFPNVSQTFYLHSIYMQYLVVTFFSTVSCIRISVPIFFYLRFKLFVWIFFFFSLTSYVFARYSCQIDALFSAAVQFETMQQFVGNMQKKITHRGTKHIRYLCSNSKLLQVTSTIQHPFIYIHTFVMWFNLSKKE